MRWSSRPAPATRRCPSRSTTPPQAGGLRLHTRIDERTAGFLALGLAKVGNRPAAVSCTSGTAVANLLPAVVEAAHAGVPLVVVTADRPARLRGSGANQTTDQVGHLRLLRPDARRRRRRPRRDPRVRPQPRGQPAGAPQRAARRAAAARRRGLGGRRRGPAVVAGHACRLPWSDSSSSPGPARSSSPGTTRARPPACSPRRRAGRSSPSRPAGVAPATTWSAPTGCCCPVSWGGRSSGSWSTATPRCRARSRACSPATTSRSSRPATAAGGPSARSPSAREVDQVDVTGSGRPGVARGLARG